MINFLRKFYQIFTREDDVLSLMRVLIFINGLQYLILSCFILLINKNYIVSLYTCYSGVFLALVFAGLFNKTIEINNIKILKDEVKDKKKEDVK